MTYRFGFFNVLFKTFAGLLPFFFIGKMVQLGTYGGDYFRFVLLGIAFSGLMSSTLTGFKQMISFEQGHGTLEALLATPTSLRAMALGRTLWNLTTVIAQMAVYLFIGSFVFHADFSQANWLASIPVMTFTTGTFLGLGMIQAGFFLIGRGESSPLEFFLGNGSRFLAGVYFPLSVFPHWLQSPSQFLPFTFALEAVRKSLLLGMSLSLLRKEIFILFVCSASLIPTGWIFFRWALAYARRQGTLGFD